MAKPSQQSEQRRKAAALVRQLSELGGGSGVPTLEELFTSDDYFGVTTATPLQRAICRIADGQELGDLAHAEHLADALSSWTTGERWDPTAPIPKPMEFVFLAATRSGKTRLSSAQAVRLALTCDMQGLKPGEVPRVPIVSLTLDLAGECFGQLAGTCLARPRLKSLLLEDPTAGRVLLRHPSGRPVEITVAAGKRAGSSLVARWLAGAIFDEAPRMAGQDDGAVVNLDDSLASIKSRLRRGAQIIQIGSPWAPAGPVYTKVQAHHGKPDERICVVRAQGQWLNPSWWTDERIASLRASSLPADQLSYRTDCLADWADPESGLISAAELDAVTRKEPAIVPSDRARGAVYVAAIDPAARMNAWTLVVKMRRAGTDVVVLVKQWHRPPGGAALDPNAVLREMATVLAPYGVRYVATDKWQVDSLKALARHHGIDLVEYDFSGQELTELYLDMAARIQQKLVELPPDAQLRSDLLAIRRRVTTSGMVIDLPTSGSGRHADYVPALARVLRIHVPDSAPAPKPAVDPEVRMIEAAKRRFIPRKPKGTRGHWWQQRLM